MILYCIILLLTSLVFFCVSAAIYGGRIDLIHDYHQKNVQDPAAYGRDFGKALALIAAAMLLSGLIALVGENLAPAAIAILLAGLAAGCIGIVLVQKKHNGGVF